VSRKEAFVTRARAKTATLPRNGQRHARCNPKGVAQTNQQTPLPTTLLDLVWRIGSDERLSEAELADAIITLIEERKVRLIGTFRDSPPMDSRPTV
jgi:hypothetical protein